MPRPNKHTLGTRLKQIGKLKLISDQGQIIYVVKRRDPTESFEKHLSENEIEDFDSLPLALHPVYMVSKYKAAGLLTQPVLGSLPVTAIAPLNFDPSGQWLQVPTDLELSDEVPTDGVPVSGLTIKPIKLSKTAKGIRKIELAFYSDEKFKIIEDFAKQAGLLKNLKGENVTSMGEAILMAIKEWTDLK